MPYASKHYPFEHKEKFEDEFPAQFIAEGLDQTRGWFYTLLILGVHLFGKAPFENVIVNGIVLAEDGKKMSKRLKNYPEPDLLLKKYGADAVRLYMINSPVVRAETLKFNQDGVREIVSSVLIPWKNSFIFLEQQVALFKKNGHGSFVFNPDHPASTNSLDNWIMASAQSLILYVKQEMRGRRLMEATLTIRISTVHCCTKTFTVLGRSYEPVYSIESTSFKGSIRKGRYSYCSQHAIRCPLHICANNGISQVVSFLIIVIVCSFHVRECIHAIESFSTPSTPRGKHRICAFSPLPRSQREIL